MQQSTFPVQRHCTGTVESSFRFNGPSLRFQCSVTAGIAAHDFQRTAFENRTLLIDVEMVAQGREAPPFLPLLVGGDVGVVGRMVDNDRLQDLVQRISEPIIVDDLLAPFRLASAPLFARLDDEAPMVRFSWVHGARVTMILAVAPLSAISGGAQVCGSSRTVKKRGGSLPSIVTGGKVKFWGGI